ncbi:unnamed protein product [Prorocentrum cordatum]|uniref:Uncharacterized protein n=1 Tax=Prorocentrum cordatum TaxID=2364126 RepID=A0ABN9PMD5_9DINO|nr:unnamed protein product [Polarella glacialis]
MVGEQPAGGARRRRRRELYTGRRSASSSIREGTVEAKQTRADDSDRASGASGGGERVGSTGAVPEPTRRRSCSDRGRLPTRGTAGCGPSRC